MGSWDRSLDGQPTLEEALQSAQDGPMGHSSQLWRARESAWAASERANERVREGATAEERARTAACAYIASAVALACDASREFPKLSCVPIAAEATEFAAHAAGWKVAEFPSRMGRDLLPLHSIDLTYGTEEHS